MVKACATGHKLCVQSKGIALLIALHVVRTILLLVVSNELLRLLRPCFARSVLPSVRRAEEGSSANHHKQLLVVLCYLRLEGRKKGAKNTCKRSNTTCGQQSKANILIRT